MTDVIAPVAAKPSLLPAIKRGAREYGLLSSLLVIIVFFQIATGGALLQPLNLTNLILQNSYIVVMALGMLMVIVCGHIDLSVGSIVGVIGSIAAVLMVQYQFDFITVSLLCLFIGGLIGAAQGYWVAFWGMPSFIVTLGGMLIFRGATIAIGEGQSIGPFPAEFVALSAGFLPDPFQGQGLKVTSLVLGVLVVACFLWIEWRARRRVSKAGGEVMPLSLFALKHGILGGAIIAFCFMLATYRGLPTVLVIMCALIGLYTFIMNRTVIGRWIYAVGGNLKAAKLSGINTARVTFFTFVNMGVLAAVAGLIFAARLNLSLIHI